MRGNAGDVYGSGGDVDKEHLSISLHPRPLLGACRNKLASSEVHSVRGPLKGDKTGQTECAQRIYGSLIRPRD